MTNSLTQDLIAALTEAAELGLTFERGTAYISAGYIEKQAALRARIDALVSELRREEGGAA